MIEMVYMICHISRPYNSTKQMNVETSKTSNIIQIQYITVQNTIVMYKYTCTLIYKCPFTQHTHVIYAQKFNMISSIYVVDMTAYYMKQHKISQA